MGLQPLLRSVACRPVRHPTADRRRGGGAVSYPAKTNYVADFSGVAPGTSLRTLAGWANASSTGAVTNRLQIQGGQIAGGSSQSFTSPLGDTLVVRDPGTADHFIQLTLGAFVSGSNMQMVVAGTDEKNCIALQFTFGTTTTTSFIVSKVVAGTATQIGGFTSTNTPLGRTPLAGDVVKFSTIGTKVFVAVNDVQLKPTGIDITGVTKGTKVGFGSFNLTTTQRFSNLVIGAHTGVATLDLDNAAWGFSNTVSQNNWPIFWPGKIGVGATITLAGTAAGTVSDVDYRVRNASSGATVKDWTRATNLSVSAGAFTAKGVLPMADTVTNPQFKIDVRAANDIDGGGSNNLATTAGITGLDYGQSNSENFGGTANVTAAIDYANAYCCAPHSAGAPWWLGGTATAQTTGVQRAILWASQLAASVGIPVGIVVSGRASYALANLVTTDTDPSYSSTGWWDNLLNDLNALHCNAGSLIYAANLTQGENEADQAASFLGSADRTAYRANFATFVTQVRGPAVAVANNIPVGNTIIGQYAGDKSTNTTFSNWNYPYQRETSFGVSDLASGVYISASLMDLKHANADPFHYTGEAYVEAGRRNGMSMAKALNSVLGLGTYTGPDGRGPRVTSVTRAGAVVSLHLGLNGATGLDQTAAGNLDAYDVYLASDPNQGTGQFPSLLGKTSTVLNTSNPADPKIDITLSAGDPGAQVKVRSFYGHWPERDKTATPAVNAQDITAIRARGTYADGSKIPVEPIYSALTSN